ncbi:cytochrome ubiquinol oxidase subunit I [Alicyclobacillus fastidiosus]|uniref:Cytochrome ubiquinol oxidase subunit I n=1 Tax=Alicyclobacillus fastidiosus TaxID=392011 RepID=A0ABY6ZJA9_9BACL|nr:cytochrome ubiquinol oxidase subunit I [Alicyclobacillus fastidiosus]WAH42916.1 cytochrome ubiquinol oxidase subunit I [Alicyclobacillus fastidiosus]GMA64861.1 putative cytochrome bd menaquinol oxidase subunit I [Alicyclobacillus fastidiosus]
MPDHVHLARALFGTSMGFHIIYATLGVGIPFMVTIAEVTYALTGDSDYAVMAKRWTRGFTVLLAVSITTGTTVALQLSLLWPKFMQLVGQVIALPFLLEIFAFFLEALFMSIYVYAADRIPRRWRIVSVLLVAIGAASSALLITDANAFMNAPQGFRMVNGKAVDIHPWQAVFNPALPTSDFHVLMTAYMSVGFITAAVAAYGLLKKSHTDRERQHQYKSLMLSLALGGVFGMIAAISGDRAAKHLAAYQPEKLAVAEGLFNTQSHAPLVIGGWVSGSRQDVIGGIKVPDFLSWLATDRVDGVVKGLNDFPRDTWPPLFLHLFFDGMVGIGTMLIFLAIFAWLVKTIRRREQFPFPKWLLCATVVSGPLAVIAIELGWIYACMGRQPWIIYHVMRTADAVTSSPYVGWMFFLFIMLYLMLAIGSITVLRSYFSRHPLSDDIEPNTPKPRRAVWLP